MMNRMAKFANELGWAAPSGLGLNNEQAGFVPTENGTAPRTARAARVKAS